MNTEGNNTEVKNEEDLPQAQDVKKANYVDTILLIIVFVCGIILRGIIPNLIAIVLAVYLLAKRYKEHKNKKKDNENK